MRAGLVGAVTAGIFLALAAPGVAQEPPPSSTTTTAPSTTTSETTTTTEPPPSSTSSTTSSSTTTTTEPPEEDLPGADAQLLPARLLSNPVTAGTDVTIRPERNCSGGSSVAALGWTVRSQTDDDHAFRGSTALAADGSWEVTFTAPAPPDPMGDYTFVGVCVPPDADLQPAAAAQEYYEIDFEVVAAGDAGVGSPNAPSSSDAARLAEPATPILAQPNFVG